MSFLKKLIFFLLTIACIASIAYSVWWLRVSDELLERVFSVAETTPAYTQIVDTTVVFTDRTLSITGMYSVDHNQRIYESISTTTLSIPGTDPKVFRTHNIATSNIIHLLVQTDDEVLQKTIPTTPWTSFPKTQIPSIYAGIANQGPVLDNLLILSGSGAYVRLSERATEEILEGTPTTHYSLSLSGATPETSIGPLPALLERVSKHGTIELWVDRETAQVRRMLLRNDEQRYTSDIRILYEVSPAQIPTL